MFQGPCRNEGVRANLARLKAAAREAAEAGAGLAGLPRDVPHRLRHRPRGGGAAGRAGRRPSAGRRPRSPGRAASRCSTAIPSWRGRRASTTRPCCSTATAAARQPPQDRTFRRPRPRRFAPATAPPTLAEIDGAAVGILICYDVEFPENVRAPGAGRRRAGRRADRAMGPYTFVAAHLVAGPGLREPAVRRLRQPLRPRGRARLSRAVLRRRPRRRATSPAPARRGADRRPTSTSRACAAARRSTPISPTADPSSTGAGRAGTQPP